MTSKAERKRHKRVARKLRAREERERDIGEEPVPPVALAEQPPRARVPVYRGPTELQEAAWRWFTNLRQTADGVGAAAAAARAELKLVRPHLTDDEYAALCETARPNQYPARRIGRSQHSTHALTLSGIRKVVVYRQMDGA